MQQFPESQRDAEDAPGSGFWYLGLGVGVWRTLKCLRVAYPLRSKGWDILLSLGFFLGGRDILLPACC